MIDLSQRINKSELMDTYECTDQEMLGALRFLKMTNRAFGGCAVILKYLNAFSASWKTAETIKILDVGCGSADISIAIAKWAESKKIKVEICGLELIPQIADFARKNTRAFPNIRIEQTDILDLDESKNSYDYVLASLVLHHIFSEHCPAVLEQFNRLSARGIIISDLERSWPAYAGIKFLSYLIGNRIVRNDGPLSVQRSFTVTELKDLAHSLGLDYLKAQKESFFRLSLVGEKR